MTLALSEEQIEQYRQVGYVSPVAALTSAEAASVRDRLETYEAERGRPVDAAERSKAHLAFKFADEIVHDSRILDAVEDLIGPNILCWNSIFWIKEAHSPNYVGWHQDLTYWGLDNPELVTVWLALSPASVESGCMQVLPGSHLELLEHDETYQADNMLTRGQELKIDLNERTAAAMTLEPGQVSLHNVRCAHGSGPNSTDDRRIGLSMHFMPTHTRQLLVEWDSATLVRGVDEFGHFEHAPRPSRDFDPDIEDFRQRAGAALREIVYAGAKPTKPSTL